VYTGRDSTRFEVAKFGRTLQGSFALNDDPGLLNQQIKRSYQEGKYREAIPIAEKILAIAKRVFGPENPDTVTSLNNLAGLYKTMGEYAKAEPLLQKGGELKRWKFMLRCDV
jgi:tetratricopeptide (TPR) repeat protein